MAFKLYNYSAKEVIEMEIMENVIVWILDCILPGTRPHEWECKLHRPEDDDVEDTGG